MASSEDLPAEVVPEPASCIRTTRTLPQRSFDELAASRWGKSAT